MGIAGQIQLKIAHLCQLKITYFEPRAAPRRDVGVVGLEGVVGNRVVASPVCGLRSEAKPPRVLQHTPELWLGRDAHGSIRVQEGQPATPAKQSLRRMARPSHGKQDLFRGQSEFAAPERGSISGNWRASRRVVSASAMQG